MIKKKYQLFILALVLVGTLLSSFHYHKDMQTVEDCPVCVIQNVFTAADVPDIFSLEAIALFFFIPLLQQSAYISTLAARTYASRAPPLFS